MHLASLMVAGVALALTGCEPLPSGTGDHTREPPGRPRDHTRNRRRVQRRPALHLPAGPWRVEPRVVRGDGRPARSLAEAGESAGRSRVRHQRTPRGMRGEVQFSGSGDTVTVKSDVAGLPAGTHAHHVHIYGDCSDPAKGSAGSHFDFERLATAGGATPPGGAATGRTASPVTGDLGNLQATGSAPATAERTLQGLNLAGTTSILGRAVVIHSGPNDPSKGPDGGAGTPIACGVIGIAPEAGAASGTPTSTTPSREAPPKR